MTLPDFETLVIERLVICLGEISAINTVFVNPPIAPVGVSDAPYAFPLVGAMVNSIPVQATGAGRVVVTRNYPITVASSSMTKDTDGTRPNGSKGYEALRLLVAPIREYFLTHASLETDAGGGMNKLQYIQGQIIYQEQGIVQDRDEGRYALQITLTVSMGATLTPTKRLA